MHVRKKTRVACSALVIGVSCVTVPAGAQSLALSYDLGVRADLVARVALPADQCSGSDWLNAIALCARDREAAALSSPEDNAAASARGSRRVSVGATGQAPAATIPQGLQAGEDPLDGRRRTADVSLRLGSKNRLLSPEENRDVGRFVDTPYERYLQNNAHKAIGLELLVPFQ